MTCDRCGVVAAALKTAKWRDRNGGPFALCNPCWHPIRDAVWILPGPVPCFGTCRSCGEWASVRALADRTGGGKWDAPSGLCQTCAPVEALVGEAL